MVISEKTNVIFQQQDQTRSSFTPVKEFLLFQFAFPFLYLPLTGRSNEVVVSILGENPPPSGNHPNKENSRPPPRSRVARLFTPVDPRITRTPE